MSMNLPHYKTVQGNGHTVCKLYVSFIAYLQLVQRFHLPFHDFDLKQLRSVFLPSHVFSMNLKAIAVE